MPASAYKDGQLKKNPLLGTATQSVPSRAKQKERLLGLYGEAKSIAGQGRAGMEGVLAGRYARFAEPEQRALGGLQSQYADIQSKAVAARDPEAKKKFFADYGDTSGIDAEEAYERDVANQVNRLAGEGKTLAAEFDRRSNALQQRINDYNLFLGQY